MSRPVGKVLLPILLALTARGIASGGRIRVSNLSGRAEANSSGGGLQFIQIQGAIHGSTLGGAITAQTTLPNPAAMHFTERRRAYVFFLPEIAGKMLHIFISIGFRYRRDGLVRFKKHSRNDLHSDAPDFLKHGTGKHLSKSLF
jgi:hypothetical protein